MFLVVLECLQCMSKVFWVCFDGFLMYFGVFWSAFGVCLVFFDGVLKERKERKVKERKERKVKYINATKFFAGGACGGLLNGFEL